MSFKVIDIQLDHKRAGEFVGCGKPAVSWRLEGNAKGLSQTAYRILAKDGFGKTLWDSGKCISAESCEIEWGGKALKSRQKGTISVTVWDNKGSKATASIDFEVALLEQGDWSARWIRYDGNNPSIYSPVPYFRKSFELPKKVKNARLYVTSRGIFEAYINGQRVGDDHFTPGWVDYRQQMPYLAYDVTELLQKGGNAIGALVGDGWYSGFFVNDRRRNNYGKHPELLMQLEYELADGSVGRIETGKGWQVKTGPILYSDIYDGERYDARLEMPNWCKAPFDNEGWKPVVVMESASKSTPLTLKQNPPVRALKELKPVKLLHPRRDTWIWDFGQNLTGNVRISLPKHRGSWQYVVRFGEMLYDNGTLYTLNYRSALSTDFFVTPEVFIETPKGRDWGAIDFVYEPKFTFHGFRYVQIDGFQLENYDVEQIDVVAVVYSCDLESAGEFECGNKKLNRLYQNVCWSQTDNFLDIPTDCPQRDERLGWTGDAQVFVGAACWNRKSLNFYRNYMRNVRETQLGNGAILQIAPYVLNKPAQDYCGATGWADAMTVIPWALYQRYGSKQALRENYDAMKRWVECMKSYSKDLIFTDTKYGDWLCFSKIKTPGDYLGTVFFYRSAAILVKSAEVLGKKDDVETYMKLCTQIAKSFRKKFVGKDGLVKNSNQTMLAIALQFGLLTDEQVPKNAALLSQLVRENGNRLDTGFLGTYSLNFALSENGHAEDAMNLYLQEEFPSWLFSVNQGATTMWERWNSYTKADGFGPASMNSFNHYAFGAIHDWVMQHVCGIQYVSAGGSVMCFCIEPDARLKYAKGKVETMHGTVSSSWRFPKNGDLQWEVSMPPNAIGTIRLPFGWTLKEGSLDDLCNETRKLVLTQN